MEFKPVNAKPWVPTARHRCDVFSKEALLPAGAMTQKWVLQTRHMLWRNTASTIKDLIFLI